MSRSEITAEPMDDEVPETSQRTYLMRRVGIVVVVVLVAVAVWALVTRDSGGNPSKSSPTTKVTPSTQLTARMPAATVLQNDAQFKTFDQLLAVSKVDLTGKDVTLLAPSTEAFDAIGAGEVAAILNDQDKAETVLKRHVLGKRMTVGDLAELDGKTVENLAGEELPVKLADGAVFVGGAKIAKSNIDAADAEIHVLGSVIAAPG